MHEMNMYANAMHVMTWYEMHENENNTHEDKDPTREINITWRRRRQELDTNMESISGALHQHIAFVHVGYYGRWPKVAKAF